MERRELLKAVGIVSAVAMVNTAHADADPHEHHHAGPGNAALVDAAFGCVKAGDACLDHCLQVLSTGDKSMSECARSVSELVAVCGALGKLATANSALLPKYAAVVRMSCDSCEKECRKHEDKHASCKACADACAACSRECARLA